MSRYAAAHANPKGPGDARPTALQIIKDEGAEGKYVGKVIVVTGASAGLGVETIRALAATGARLILTARNLEKAGKALKDFFDPARMELVHMDNESMESVRTAAAQILLKSDNKISILVANAGNMCIPTRELTVDGFERQMACNHLSHFLLFHLLKDALVQGSSPALNSRVVILASAAHIRSGISEDGDYHYAKTPYDPYLAYGQSKTASIYMANEIERRYGSSGVHAISLHPGTCWTDLGQYLPAEYLAQFSNGSVEQWKLDGMKNPAQGAATTVWAAVGNEFEGKGGKYLDSMTEARPTKDPVEALEGYAEHIWDEEKAARLWMDSLKMVGLEPVN
jgi:NAD(P)-dependent dehydrogenase (short-subunit alcohol dehydrogenase family)